jgi:hypothetical protein
MTLPIEARNTLAERNALVLGVERPAGRRVAVALAEAGANVAVVTLSEDTQAEFAANSTANEFWALGRKGIALISSDEQSLAHAIDDATAALGPISIICLLVWHPLSRSTLAGLRSDPAMIIVIEADNPAAAALLAWTRDLAGAGLRANALVASRAIADAIGPVLKEHHPPEPMDLARSAVYLASDATAAIEGAMVVVDEP